MLPQSFHKWILLAYMYWKPLMTVLLGTTLHLDWFCNLAPISANSSLNQTPKMKSLNKKIKLSYYLIKLYRDRFSRAYCFMPGKVSLSGKVMEAFFTFKFTPFSMFIFFMCIQYMPCCITLPTYGTKIFLFTYTMNDNNVMLQFMLTGKQMPTDGTRTLTTCVNLWTWCDIRNIIKCFTFCTILWTSINTFVLYNYIAYRS